MPAIVQICAVIVTMAIVAIAIMTVRTMLRFEKAADELSETTLRIRESLNQLDGIARESREVIDGLAGLVPMVQRSVSRFVDLADRTSQISGAVLEEIEAPVRTAVAVARGVRTGTSRFVERIGQRFRRRFADHNGGVHE